jgi:hypothetical protein
MKNEGVEKDKRRGRGCSVYMTRGHCRRQAQVLEMLPLRSGWNCQYLSLSEPCEKGEEPATFSGNPLGTDTTPEVDSGKKGQEIKEKRVISYKSILETSLNEPIDKG